MALRHGAGTISLVAGRDADDLVIVVSDQGPGFPRGFADRAFDRFARAETGRTSSGTGLGLAITRAVVEAHGGTVSAAAGSGAPVRVFVVRCVLPGAAARAERSRGTRDERYGETSCNCEIHHFHAL
jgi:signal transduction histidine kinase